MLIETHALTKTVVNNADNGGGQELHILSNIVFQLQAAESVAIVGPSGAGKSTLLSLLAGLDRPTAGTVLWQGEDIYQWSEDGRAARRGMFIGFVFQSFQLLPGLTALENVMLPLMIRGGEAIRARALESLEGVGLAHRVHHYPAQLSGGEQQRVAIARAFAPRPPVLLADEPTGNLDQQTGGQVVELLFSLVQQEGTALCLITHDQGLAGRCQRRVRLQDGRMAD